MGEHHVIVHRMIELFGLNLSITNFVVILWLGGLFTFLFLVGAARAMKEDGTGRFANLVESMLEFVRENVSDAFMGHHGAKWFPFVATVFFFILFSNLIGLIGFPVTFMRARATSTSPPSWRLSYSLSSRWWR